MFCVNTGKTSTSVDMIKDRTTHRMNAWVITIQSVCTGLCRHGLQLFQSFPNGISIGEMVVTCSPTGKSWTKSKWISSGDKNSQRLSLRSLKQSTAASAEHSLPFRKPAPIYVSFPLHFIIFCSQSLHLIKNGMVMFIVSSRRTR